MATKVVVGQSPNQTQAEEAEFSRGLGTIRLHYARGRRHDRVRNRVPASSLWIQGLWAVLLVLPRTYDPVTKLWGNLYSNLLDYVISAALIFYALTVAAVFRLRWKRPDTPRPYRALGQPLVPAAYIVTAATILIVLFAYRPATTWPGLAIVILGLPVYCLILLRGKGTAKDSVTEQPAIPDSSQ